jgi:5'-AMP-activated protein kinase beta subunit, interaction domain/Glycogen recognition site of AMP-activated protein kinase
MGASHSHPSNGMRVENIQKAENYCETADEITPKVKKRNQDEILPSPPIHMPFVKSELAQNVSNSSKYKKERPISLFRKTEDSHEFENPVLKETIEGPFVFSYTLSETLIDPHKAKVFVFGTFNQRGPMVQMNLKVNDREINVSRDQSQEKTNKNTYCSIPIDLEPGIHKFRFLINGEWSLSSKFASIKDDDGLMVNILEVFPSITPRTDGDSDNGSLSVKKLANEKDLPHSALLSLSPPNEDDLQIFNEDQPEHIDILKPVKQPLNVVTDGISSIEISPISLFSSKIEDSPPDSYSYFIPRLNDDQESAPCIPPQLTNISITHHGLMEIDGEASMREPPHFALNRLFVSTLNDSVFSLAVVTRYRSKYVTTIHYCPIEL